MKISTKHLNDFLINKFFSLELHVGNHKTLWQPQTKAYLKGFRHKFCIIDPNLTFIYFRQGLKFILNLLVSKKKILFIGGPFGLEKEFSLLCSKYGHFNIDKEIQGFFTNYSNISSINSQNIPIINNRPALFFVFSPSKNTVFIKEALKLNIPIMGFINTDENPQYLDFPIPANIKSQKGSFFIYNLFFHLFKVQSR